MTNGADPHALQRVLAAGEPLQEARAAMIMVHGRGASAANILGLSAALKVDGFAYLAPEASGNTWYPYSFLQPLEHNEPHLSSALGVVGQLVDHIVEAGVPTDRLMLLGFSQGACLSLEFAARNPARYGGIVGFSGGLIGPPDTLRDYPGSLEGTPVFLGSSDPDSHIPVERVHETDAVLTGMGAAVLTRIYPGMGHMIDQDEIDAAREMMEVVLGGRR